MTTNELENELAQIHSDSLNWSLRCCFFNEQMAQEVLQESYIKLLNKIDQFEGNSSLKTWLFTIIRNTAIDMGRSQQRRVLKEGELENESIKDATQEMRLRKKNDHKRIQQSLKNLSPREGEVIELVVYQELKLKEAAEIMGITLSSVNSYLLKAKEKIKNDLTKPGHYSKNLSSFKDTWTLSLEYYSKKDLK